MGRRYCHQDPVQGAAPSKPISRFAAHRLPVGNDGPLM
jgi:hypothetical protein